MTVPCILLYPAVSVPASGPASGPVTASFPACAESGSESGLDKESAGGIPSASTTALTSALVSVLPLSSYKTPLFVLRKTAVQTKGRGRTDYNISFVTMGCVIKQKLWMWLPGPLTPNSKFIQIGKSDL